MASPTTRNTPKLLHSKRAAYGASEHRLPKTLETARQNNDHRLLTKSGFKDDFFGVFSANAEGCFLPEMDHNNLLYQLMAIQMVYN